MTTGKSFERERHPLISIVVPVMNGGRFIGGAIRSIVEQDYPEVEIIVVDGRSTDDSARIARSFPQVKFITQRGVGLSDGWNVGIQVSSGRYVGFLDSDDRFKPGKLTAQAEVLARNPGVQVVSGSVQFFLDDDSQLPATFRPQLLDRPVRAEMPGTWLVRRELFDAVGDFDPRLRIAGDMDWYRRAVDSGAGMQAVDDVVLTKRIHGGNLSMGRLAGNVFNREILVLLKRSIDRRRRSGS